ncbi:MAG TPA: hypothetical protein VJ739_14910, partial [Gemmataceae bacterium]|nr:hypothetical protein [Gemmataceae bacterium]
FQGAGVGLAIVPARVTRMLEGGVTSARLVARRLERGTAEVEAQVALLDPLHRIRAAALHYVRLDRPPDRPAPAAQRDGSELPGSRRVDLKVEGHRATATFPVETNGRTELHLSFQVSTVNAAGARTYLEPAGVTLDLRPLTAAPSPAAPGAPGEERSSPPVELKAPALAAERTVVPLPAAVGGVAVGGGGRYLVLHLPALRKLALFDVNVARVVHYFPLPADAVQFTAGRDLLFIGLPADGRVQRWSLSTRRREQETAWPLRGPMKSLVMGSDADGPLLAGGVFLDAHTLRPLPFQEPEKPFLPHDDGTAVRASADGQLYGLWRPGNPFGAFTYVLGDRRFQEAARNQQMVGYVLPGPAGDVVYTQVGLRSPRGRALGAEGGFWGNRLIPAARGNYYLAIDAQGPSHRGPCVYVAGDDRPLVRLAGVELGEEVNVRDSDVFPTDRRIHFVPAAKVIITIPVTNDRLVLYKADVEAALEESDTDYLFVTSPMPPPVRKGETLDYTLAVRSRRGGVSCRLKSGPRGMTVSPAGRVTWPVPRDWREPEAVAAVRVRDRTGQEHLYSFAVTVREVRAQPGAVGDEPSR